MGLELQYTDFVASTEVSSMAEKRLRNSSKYSANKSRFGISLTPSAFHCLSEIAKDKKLSKSQLVEGIVKGTIAIASSSTEQVSESNKDSVSREVYESLKKEYEQQERAIADLREQLSQQLRAKEGEIAKLLSQQERSAEQLQGNNQSLQQQISTKEAQIEELRKNYKSLEQKFEEQTRIVSNLEKQLSEQKASVAERAEKSKSSNWGIILFLILLIFFAALLLGYYYTHTTALN